MIRRKKPLTRKTPVKKKRADRARMENPFKRSPIRDRKFLRFVREKMSCLCCGDRPVDPHHVTTRKNGGGDVAVNIMPLCREHHREIHAIGIASMVDAFPVLKAWLVAAERTDVIDRMERMHGPVKTES